MLNIKKYIKYANKTKHQHGGDGRYRNTINMNQYKDLFHKMMNELNVEIQFTISIDEHNNLLTEIYKGIPAEVGKPLFLKCANFAYITCHTHPPKMLPPDGSKYFPPSGTDYVSFIETYFKYGNVYNYVFAPEGIYKISLGEKLLSTLWTMPYFNAITQDLPALRRYNTFNIKNAYDRKNWNHLMNLVYGDTNGAHIMLAKPDMIEDIPFAEYVDKMMEHGFPKKIISFDDYMDFIRDVVGFDIEFTNWSDDFIMHVDIDMRRYKLVNSTIIAKKHKILKNLLLFDEYSHLEQSDVNEQLDEEGFFNLNNANLDQLFDAIKNLPNGELLKFA